MNRELVFWKYQGTGNDFVMLDGRLKDHRINLDQADIQYMCDRHFGIGADGLIILEPSDQLDFRMKYYNADGMESTMCGNGGRCLVAFARERRIEKDIYKFDAIDGLHEASIHENGVELLMTKPTEFKEIRSQNYWINTGSPHHVQIVGREIAELEVNHLGKEIRYDSSYVAIGGTNVNFLYPMGSDKIRVRTFERGVENETLSCGTGAVASAYIHKLLNPQTNDHIQVHTEGGLLTVRMDSFGSPKEKVYLSGPVKRVFSGTIDLTEKSII